MEAKVATEIKIIGETVEVSSTEAENKLKILLDTFFKNTATLTKDYRAAVDEIMKVENIINKF